MAEPYPHYNELDDAISAALKDDEDTPPGAIIIGWTVAVAYRSAEQLADPEGDNRATHAYFSLDGMPPYAVVGLLQITQDWIRGLGGGESS